jgi:cytochrome c
MKPLVRISAGLAIVLGSFASVASAAPPAAATACAACHSEDGTQGIGPSFKAVYGRKAGTAKGFNYSAAMKKADVTWNESTLDAFLENPQKAIPGNAMPYPGVPDEKRRAEIIDYLKTLK